jgi:Fic family protein
MKYSWRHPDWPNFTFDDTQCRDALYRYALEAGRLSGGMSQLENTLQYDAYIDLMVSEAINTSQIEGERLNREDVRSSIKNFLGLSNPPTRVADPRAEGMAALMVDVRNGFAGELTKATLFHWHQLVLPLQENSLLPRDLNVGQWRDSEEPMQIVSGPIGYEKVHYEAPPLNQVDAERSRFLDWFNRSNPLKVERDIVLSGPVLSLSTIIEKDKNAYYNGLNKASQFNLDITDWVKWFVDSVLMAQQEAAQKVDFVLKKSKFWEKHQHTELNERKKKVLNKPFNAGSDGFEGGLSAKKYMGITSSSKATATRDLGDLVEKECLCRLEGGGRNARYGVGLE